MTTLFDATLALAKALGNVRTSNTTTTGSATTIVDSTRTERADYWNGGTLWINSGTHQGKSRKITDWDLSTTTFTIPTTTTAVASVVSYSVLNGDWPQDKLIEFVNAAAQEYGGLVNSDDSLVSVADQEGYALPTGVANVSMVEIALSKTAPYYFVPHYGWREVDGYIRFDTGRALDTAGYTIRLWYEDKHAVLSADADVVQDRVNLERLTWEAAAKAWQWRIELDANSDRPQYVQRLTLAMAKAAELRAKYPSRHATKAPRLTL